MKRVQCIALYFFLSFLLVCCSSEPQRWYKKGSKLVRQGDRFFKKYSDGKRPGDLQKSLDYYNEAIEEFEKVIRFKIEAGRKSVYVYKRLGDLMLGEGFFDDACRYYKKALELKQNDSELHLSLGICYANIGRIKRDYLDLALQEYRKAIELSPDLSKPYFGLAMVLYKKEGCSDEVVRNLKKAVELDPYFVKACGALGRMYYERGEYDKAIKVYRDLIFTSPDEEAYRFPENSWVTATFFSNIGVVCKAKGDRQGAISYFRLALRSNPDCLEARQGLESLGIDWRDALPEQEKRRRRWWTIKPH